MRKTKIVCTLGPASASVETIRRLVEDGMGVARINTAHGSVEQYESLITNLRIVDPDLPVMLDLKGPEVRLKLPSEKISFTEGQIIEIAGSTQPEHPYFTLDIFKLIDKDQVLHFADARFTGIVIEKGNNSLSLKMLSTGTMNDLKGINFPGLDLNLPTLSSRDLSFLPVIERLEIPMVALSFVQQGSDIKTLRRLIGRNAVIIAKIENNVGIKHIFDISQEADALMVARGGLGGELGLTSVPVAQQKIITSARDCAIPVITATEMLGGMIERPVPSRAEVSDIAHSILDGSDAIMLSGETAIGRYPIQALKIMAETAQKIEAYQATKSSINPGSISGKSLLGDLSRMSKEGEEIRSLILLTNDTDVIYESSRMGISQPLVIFSTDMKVVNSAKLIRGVSSFFLSETLDHDSLLEKIRQTLIGNKIQDSGAFLLYLGNWRDKEAKIIISVEKI